MTKPVWQKLSNYQFLMKRTKQLINRGHTLPNPTKRNPKPIILKVRIGYSKQLVTFIKSASSNGLFRQPIIHEWIPKRFFHRSTPTHHHDVWCQFLNWRHWHITSPSWQANTQARLLYEWDYTLKSAQWTTIRWAKFELEYLLLIFIYQIFWNSKSLAKTPTLNAGASEPISKKNRLKFITLHSPNCLFLIKILWLNCHPEYFGVYFSWRNQQMRFKMVHYNTKKVKSRFLQSQEC